MSTNYVKNPAKLLIESGLLFEINRRVLQPHGLALAVTWPETSEEEAAAEAATSNTMLLQDHRDDPEGMIYDPECFKECAAQYDATVEAARPRLEKRRAALGYVIQGASPDDMAQRAYAAYGECTGWTDYLGKPMPKWGELPEALQDAWRAAARVVGEP